MGGFFFLRDGQPAGLAGSHQTACLLLSIAGALLLFWGILKVARRKALAPHVTPPAEPPPAPLEPAPAKVGLLSDHLRK